MYVWSCLFCIQQKASRLLFVRILWGKITKLCPLPSPVHFGLLLLIFPIGSHILHIKYWRSSFAWKNTCQGSWWWSGDVMVPKWSETWYSHQSGRHFVTSQKDFSLLWCAAVIMDRLIIPHAHKPTPHLFCQVLTRRMRLGRRIWRSWRGLLTSWGALSTGRRLSCWPRPSTTSSAPTMD